MRAVEEPDMLQKSPPCVPWAISLSTLIAVFSGPTLFCAADPPQREAIPLPATPASPAEVQSCLRLLHSAVEENGKLLAGLPARISKLDHDLGALLQTAQDLQFDRPEKAPPPEPKKQQVYYRPPMRRFVTGKSGLLLVCEEGRVSHIDPAPLSTFVNQLMADVKANIATIRSKSVPMNLECPGSDFRIMGTFDVAVERTGSSVRVRLEGKVHVARKPQCRGETAEEIVATGSRFRKLLGANPSDKYLIQFSVYPDSHDVFRRAREFVWGEQYQVDWAPKKSAQAINLGTGVGTTQ
jgi:hypothetical protein